MSYIVRINKDMEKKFEKLENGENSIQIINKKVSEISKLELNVNNFFLKS